MINLSAVILLSFSLILAQSHIEELKAQRVALLEQYLSATSPLHQASLKSKIARLEKQIKEIDPTFRATVITAQPVDIKTVEVTEKKKILELSREALNGRPPAGRVPVSKNESYSVPKPHATTPAGKKTVRKRVSDWVIFSMKYEGGPASPLPSGRHASGVDDTKCPLTINPNLKSCSRGGSLLVSAGGSFFLSADTPYLPDSLAQLSLKPFVGHQTKGRSLRP